MWILWNCSVLYHLKHKLFTTSHREIIHWKCKMLKMFYNKKEQLLSIRNSFTLQPHWGGWDWSDMPLHNTLKQVQKWNKTEDNTKIKAAKKIQEIKERYWPNNWPCVMLFYGLFLEIQIRFKMLRTTGDVQYAHANQI